MFVVMKGLSIILYFLITLYTDGQMGEGPRSEHEASPMPVLAGHDHVRQKWLKVGRELFCLLSCRACSGGPRRACLPQLSVTQQSDGRSRGGSHVCESLAGWDAH